MKKILSLMIAAILITGLCSVPTLAAGNENLCKFFQKTVGIAVSDYFGTDLDGIEGEYEKVPVGFFFIKYVQNRMKQDGSLAQYKVENTDSNSLLDNYKVPFSVFEAKAKSIADYSGDLKAAVGGAYDSASDCMLLDENLSDGVNQGHPAFVIGYNDNGNNTYTVYVQRMQYGYSTVEEVEKEFADYFEDYSREKDIFVDDEGLYHLVHRNIFYIAEIKYENGSVFYNSVKEADNLDGISMITRDTVISTDTSVKVNMNGCSVSAENGVFPAGTVVTVEKLTGGKMVTLAQASLKDIASKMTVFEITAKNNNAAVQPNGKVTAAFAVPDGYDMDALAVYFLTTDGKVQKMKAVVDKTAKTVTAELSHFSTYVLVQTKSADSPVTSPKTGDTGGTLPWSILALAGFGIVAGALITGRKEQLNRQ